VKSALEYYQTTRVLGIKVTWINKMEVQCSGALIALKNMQGLCHLPRTVNSEG
jgi:hypothetical protein